MGALEVLKSRNNTKAIEAKFTQRILESEARTVLNEQKRIASRYRVSRDIPEINRSTYQVATNKLTYVHPIRQRFIDMKRIKGERQTPVPIHNKVLFSSFNRLVRSMAFGLTDDIKELISAEFKIHT